MKILILGATGFIGKHLVAKLLDRDHEVYIFTRNDQKARDIFGERVFIKQWRTDDYIILQEYAHKVDVVINLAGENIGTKRWSSDQKMKILSSRVNIGKALSFALKQSHQKPYLLIQSSAIAYYGFSEEEEFTEESANGEGFLPMVVRQWEDSVRNVQEDNTRKIFIRTGIVLGTEGGMLPRMLPAFKLYLGGPLGNGRQWLSWIHIDDFTEAVVELAETEKLSGSYNLTAPHPVTMDEFAKTLARVLHKPAWFRVPGFILKALFGSMARETMLQGQKVLPKRLRDIGFVFRHPHLEEALRDLLKR